MYLHELGEEEASFTKDEMQAGKHQDYEQKLSEHYLATPTPCSSSTNTSSSASSKPSGGNGLTTNSTSTESAAPVAVNGPSTSKSLASRFVLLHLLLCYIFPL